MDSLSKLCLKRTIRRRHFLKTSPDFSAMTPLSASMTLKVQKRASKEKINLFALTMPWATGAPQSSEHAVPPCGVPATSPGAARSRLLPEPTALLPHARGAHGHLHTPVPARTALGGRRRACPWAGVDGQEAVAQCRELLFCSSKAILPTRSWLSSSTPLTGSWKKFISAAKAAMAEGSWPN